MKTIQICSKRDAENLIVASLFTPVNGRTLSKSRFDRGKYRTNPDTPYIGRTLEVSDDVCAVYPERRRDAHGAYIALFCVYSH
jgi:hypothetical protein